MPLAEDVKAFNKLNIKQVVIEIELCFKQDYYNKVYGNAQAAAQQAFQNQQQIGQGQLGLGQAQMGLSNFQRAGLGADVGALGQLGSLRQGHESSSVNSPTTSGTNCSL